jgi:hypothetical protein
MALDLSRIGADLQNISGVVGGVNAVVQGGPGGSAAQAEQNDFSLARLGDVLGGIGNILNPPKPQPPPTQTLAPTSPTTGEPLAGLPVWVPLAAAGVVGLLLVVLIVRR